MRRLRLMALVVVLLGVLVRPTMGCGPDPDEDVFVQVKGPDGPYAAYAAGRLGVIDARYRVRHLVIAYSYMDGRPLTPEEQVAAVDVERFFNEPYAYDHPQGMYAPAAQVSDAKATGGWADVEAAFIKNGQQRMVPGQQYQSFTNCLEDAHASALRTYDERRQQHGDNDPEVQEWLRGQAAVFSNCSAKGVMPAAVAQTTSLWLRQDRAYQTAAADFYATNYDAAVEEFQAIAKDQASPWSGLAPYLVARTYIRRALVPDAMANGRTGADADAERSKAQAAIRAGLEDARRQLEAIRKDPAGPMAEASGHLLDYVNARLDPDGQAEVLARRLEKPASGRDYRQNVIDLSLIRGATLSDYSNALAPLPKKPRPAEGEPMLVWMDAVTAGAPVEAGAVQSTGVVTATQALAKWKEARSDLWLIAALMQAQPGSVAANELIAAAKQVPKSSPAYAAATYHRLRLKKTDPASYAEVAALMPALEKTESRSTINLYGDLERQTAPTLDQFLQTAASVPAGLGDAEGNEGGQLTSGKPLLLCGVDTAAPSALHFDATAATILNQRLPLRILREAALSPVLPGNLRFDLAHAAWTRAVLLNDVSTARALSPVLAKCQPAFAEWLSKYDSAKTEDDRHVAGLMALMRFTSTEPIVRTGIQRDFAAYDEFRDNWWREESAEDVSRTTLFGSVVVMEATIQSPPFLSKADAAQAAREIGELEHIPGAADYFGSEALAWFRTHPNDRRNADLLGFAKRVMRNAPRTKASTELDHQLFLALQQHYPESEWAKRYTTWE